MFNRDVTSSRIANRLGSLSGLPLVFGLVLAACSDHPRGQSGALQATGGQEPVGQAPGTGVSSRKSGSSEVQVVVELTDTPLAVLNTGTPNADTTTRRASALSSAQQRDYLRVTEAHLNALTAQIQGMGGRELARLSKALRER